MYYGPIPACWDSITNANGSLINNEVPVSGNEEPNNNNNRSFSQPARNVTASNDASNQKWTASDVQIVCDVRLIGITGKVAKTWLVRQHIRV
jgi:hypothetical protein